VEFGIRSKFTTLRLANGEELNKCLEMALSFIFIILLFSFKQNGKVFQERNGLSTLATGSAYVVPMLASYLCVIVNWQGF
jgi:ABC-type xylose transport system permease subunit